MEKEDAARASPGLMLAVLLPAIFLLALLGVSFAREPVYYVAQSDAPCYLAVARSEPSHLAFDERLYVLHPPAYPCAIRIASAVTGDVLRGAVLLGTLAAAGLVLVTFRLGRALGLGPLDSLAGAIVLGCSHVLAYTAQGVYREPWQALVLHGLALALVAPCSRAAPIKPRRRAAIGIALAVLAGWTWDPIVLAAPLFLAAGWLVRRPRLGLVLALALVGAWLSWAEARRERLVAQPTYPAGIDGMVEETSPLPAAAFLNPNFLPETKAHNAHFWPRHPTPGHALALLGPEALAPSSIYIDFPPEALADELRPLGSASAAILGLGLAGAISLAAGARTIEGRERARRFAAVVLPLGFLGAPGLLGNTGRYAAMLVPSVALLAGHGALSLVRLVARAPLDERRGTTVLLGLWALVAGAGVARGPHLAVARPAVYEARAVAEVLERVAPGARVAAHVDWPGELLWLLPGRRVVALPLRGERLDRFFEDYGSEVLVVPLEVRFVGDPHADPAGRDHALGLSALAEIASRSCGASPSLVRLGVAFEAEVTDAPRLHAYELIARRLPGKPTPVPFEFYLPAGEGAAVARAILAGRATPLEVSLLKEHRAAIAASGEATLADLLARLP